MHMEKMANLDNDNASDEQVEYRLYKRRYFLLATLFMLNLSNAMVSFRFELLM